jgi:hypothetical protein
VVERFYFLSSMVYFVLQMVHWLWRKTKIILPSKLFLMSIKFLIDGDSTSFYKANAKLIRPPLRTKPHKPLLFFSSLAFEPPSWPLWVVRPPPRAKPPKPFFFFYVLWPCGGVRTTPKGPNPFLVLWPCGGGRTTPFGP